LRGRLALIEERRDEALREIARAVELAPWDWSWRLELADLHIARGERERARRVMVEAVEKPTSWAEDWASRVKDLGPLPEVSTPPASPGGG
jgi:lipopolysaccharide biosynthesis regulator YciM